MTVDPFNPYPGPRHEPLPGDDRHERIRRMEAQNGGKAYLWVPAAILGGVAAVVVLASL